MFGHSFRTSAGEAALVNGTAAHALDYDDVQVNMRGHPSAPLLPVVLALGEKLRSSGREVTEAFVLGFEVECKLGRAIGEPHYALGWHATSTFGSLGAAAASARLLCLDAQVTANALGIAASLASGLQQNFGTMTKPLHAGWAARNGVTAAQLAAAGMTADAQAIEGEHGFLRAMSGGAEIDAEAVVRGRGDPWEILSPGIGVKLYPCCYATHRAIDAALAVREMSEIRAGGIGRVEAVVSPGTLAPLIRRPPATGLEAKFSLEYCIASALFDGGVGLGSFTDEAVGRGEVRELTRLLTVTEAGRPAQFPIEGTAEVTVVTRNGRHYSRRVEMPRGDPANPLSCDELTAKFRECAALVLSEAQVERLVGLVKGLEELPDIRELTTAAGGKR